ncbi:MAG: cyclic nucleotide-binding domain-containing protein, partial [Armatimonadota bacterium]|nr:cyclic nucleotide-binding domain-containing protein [Armatimonadota bacterium]
MTIASDPGRIAQALRACVLFSGLEAPQLDRLIGLATEATWPAGRIVFREGEPDDRLYIVVEGLVALETHVPGRGRVTIQTIGPCEVLGWSAVVPGVETKTASARTLQPTRVIVMDAGALHAACEEDHH